MNLDTLCIHMFTLCRVFTHRGTHQYIFFEFGSNYTFAHVIYQILRIISPEKSKIIRIYRCSAPHSLTSCCFHPCPFSYSHFTFSVRLDPPPSANPLGVHQITSPSDPIHTIDRIPKPHYFLRPHPLHSASHLLPNHALSLR